MKFPLLKTTLPLLWVVAAFSCNPDSPKERATAIDEAVWIARKCTNAQKEEILCQYGFLRLFKNGKFAGGALRGYAEGNWEYDSTHKLIILKPGDLSADNEKTLTFLLPVYHSENYLQLGIVRSEDDFETGNIPLISMKAARVDAETDPFDAQYNLWRRPPVQAESTDQIKQRVTNYLHFLEKFYTFLVTHKIEKADTDWFPNVVNMNGEASVRMAYNTELKEWNSCFFNEEQAIEGYKMLSGTFYYLKLKSETGIYERNVDVVNQMLLRIEQGNR